MKSLFLFTVLFVLLAFAFKDPGQSAWDFAKEVSSNVIQKVNDGGEGEKGPKSSRNLENRVTENFEDIRKRLERGEKKVKPSEKKTKPIEKKTKPTVRVANKSPKERKRIHPTEPKQVPSVRFDEAPIPLEKPIQAPRRLEEEPPQLTIKPAPSLPARPLEEVVAEPLGETLPIQPEIKVTPPKISSPIDSAELAEIGARFDRASRLLSEIK
jgi:hypothetical protein